MSEEFKEQTELEELKIAEILVRMDNLTPDEWLFRLSWTPDMPGNTQEILKQESTS